MSAMLAYAGLLIGANDVAPNPLLVAGLNNCINNSSEARAYTHCQIRWTYIIGSGDLSHVGIVMNNTRAISATNQILDNQNAVTIIESSLEYNGITAPITFSGSRSKVMAAGEVDVLSDLISASAFSVSEIPKGATIAVKIHASNSAISMFIPVGNRHITSGGQARWYNPANTTSSSVDAPGVWTSTGTAVDSRNNGWQPIVVGRYTSSDVKVYGCFGDSITQGTGDSGGTSRAVGLGWPGLALGSTDGEGQMSYINWGVHGSATTLATNNSARYFSITKYINRATLLYATNNFANTGTGQTLAQVQTAISTILASLKSATGSQVSKIIVGHLPPRTTSTDSWVTLANQSYSGAGWQPGGNVDLYNQWLTGLVGTSVDAAVHWDYPRDATDPFKWLTNSATTFYATTDGTHPSTLSHTGMAAEIRPVMDTVD